MMKTFLSLFVSCFFSAILLAQNTQEFSMQFSKENAASKIFQIEEYSEWDFVAISAYTLKENCEAQISFRFLKNEEWSKWKSLPEFHEGQTSGRTTFQAKPLSKTFEKIQFKSSLTETEPFVFRLFFGGAEKKSPNQKNVIPNPVAFSKANLGISTDTANCSCPQPAICGRLCWCPDSTCPIDPTPTPTIATHLIVHHSAGGNSITNFPALVESYYDFHTNTNGWDDIGYNWLVDPNGVIYEGRGLDLQGAHFSCMNEETVGICMIGNYVDTFPTDTSVRSLQKLLAWLACRENIDPAGNSYHTSSQLNLFNISAHLDGNPSIAPAHCSTTACPGDSLYLLMPTIRLAVENFACLGDVGLKETDFQSVDFFPNPVSQTLFIKVPKTLRGQSAELAIFSAEGKLLRKQDAFLEEGGNFSISIAEFSDGIFLGKLKFDSEVFSFRFSVEN